MYVYGTEFSYITNSWDVTYSIVDTRTREILDRKIITDGTDKEIEKPYGIMVHPRHKGYLVIPTPETMSPLVYSIASTARGRRGGGEGGKYPAFCVGAGSMIYN